MSSIDSESLVEIFTAYEIRQAYYLVNHTHVLLLAFSSLLEACA